MVSWVLLCMLVGTCVQGEKGRGLFYSAAGGCRQLVHFLWVFSLAMLPNRKQQN